MAGNVTDNPANEVAEAIVNHLRSLAPSFDIPAEQIRKALDVSGQPKELAGITVAVADKGGHNGMPGRILVDVAPEIVCWTHINDDADGSTCTALSGGVMWAMSNITYSLPNWRVAYNGNWTATATGSADQFRMIKLTATIPLISGKN